MRRFFSIGRWWIPKHFVYAVATTATTLVVLLLLLPLIGWLAALALIPAVLSGAVQWYEALTLWRRRPLFRKE